MQKSHYFYMNFTGGSGALSYGFLEKYPEMSATIFEVPPVIEMIKERFLPANEHLTVHLRAGMHLFIISSARMSTRNILFIFG